MKTTEPWLLISVFIITVAALIYFRFVRKITFKIEMTWLALGLCPILIWLLTTGRLTEFTAFGISAKLRDASENKIVLTLDGEEADPIMISRIETIDISANSAAPKTLPWVIVQRDIVLTQDLLKCLLEECITVGYYVFVDTKGNFLGFAQGSDPADPTTKTLTISEFIDTEKSMINVETILSNNLAIRDKIIENSSRGEALKTMIDMKVQHIAVVDVDKLFIGFLVRNKLLENIVADLVIK